VTHSGEPSFCQGSQSQRSSSEECWLTLRGRRHWEVEMKKSNSAVYLILMAASMTAGVMAAQGATYPNPKYRGYALDWCYIFENQCGKPAADAFCKSAGQGQAIQWAILNNPGYQTMTIGQNSICDPSSHVCDTFSFIECQSLTKTFSNPSYRGYRLDWCRIFENDCGQPAANAFCKAMGFSGSASFQFQANPGVATMTIGQNSICNPQVHRCDSFSSITCQ
jgi:hypothetical protein